MAQGKEYIAAVANQKTFLEFSGAVATFRPESARKN